MGKSTQERVGGTAQEGAPEPGLYSDAMADTPLSLALFWIAVVAYLVALVLFVIYLPLRRRWVADLALGAVMTGWPFHGASIITRALEANHWPLGNMYEYSTAIAFVVMTTFIVLALRARMRL